MAPNISLLQMAALSHLFPPPFAIIHPLYSHLPAVGTCDLDNGCIYYSGQKWRWGANSLDYAESSQEACYENSAYGNCGLCVTYCRC